MQIFGRNYSDNTPEAIKSKDGSIFVMEAPSDALLWSAMARFDAAADMPADITNSANVLADIVSFTNIPANTFKFKTRFHLGSQGLSGTTAAAPICMGALLTVNAPDLTTAALRLLYSDITGGSTVSSYKTGVYALSGNCSELTFELPIDDPLIRIDAIGIYSGFTPTNIIPSFLSILGLA